MYPPPAGTALTDDQARELDDTFLSSDPFQYFRARIASLLMWQEHAPIGDHPTAEASGASVRGQFNQYLQFPAVDAPFSEIEVHAQVAADSLSVRHHAAEALVRFACARLAPKLSNDPACLWAELSTGPIQIEGVISRLNESAQEPDPGGRMLRALIPADVVEAAHANAEIIDAANVFLEWIFYAMSLLIPAQIDLHAAHNKVKHGLAVRPRADMRVTFVTQRPNADGSVPLSAFTSDEAVDVFDQPVLEFLAVPKVDGHRQGLELTQLRLKPAAILADAFMLAMAHGAMFHVAASEHFAGRRDLPDHLGPPGFPGYPVGGPRPEHIDAQSPLGMRFPITLPPGGGSLSRTGGIGFRDYFQTIYIDYDGRTRGQVVDDENL